MGADERGSATIWGLTIIVGLAAALMLGLTVGAAVIQRHRAARAAELAAVAGAGQVFAGSAAVCRRAGEIARWNGADLDGCDVNGANVAVQVSLVEGPQGWLGHHVLAPARGRARAGS